FEPSTIGTAGVSLSHVSRPSDLSIARYLRVFDHNRSKCCGSACIRPSDACAQAAWLGLIAAEKTVCFEFVRRYSMTSREAATNPPVLASDFERLPHRTSTLSFSPK